MNSNIIQLRAKAEAEYITSRNTTIRDTAKCRLCLFRPRNEFEDQMIAVPPEVKSVESWLTAQVGKPVNIIRIIKVSKTTVHMDVTQRLENPELQEKVRSVLNVNIDERHIRGGMSTQKKYKH